MGSGFYVAHYANDRTSLDFQGPLIDGGPEYYGIMWLLFEQLMEAPDSKVKFSQIRALAHQCFSTPDRINGFLESAIESGLFCRDEDSFWCPTLTERVQTSLAALPLKKRKAAEPKEEPKPRRAVNEYTPEFERFWEAYPRRDNKVGAYRQYKANLENGATDDQMLTAAYNYAKARAGTDVKYTLMPSTFLGESERWKEFLAIRSNIIPISGHERPRKNCPVCGTPEPEGNMATCPECGFNLFDANNEEAVEEYKRDYKEGNFVSFNPGSLAQMLQGRVAKTAIPF